MTIWSVLHVRCFFLNVELVNLFDDFDRSTGGARNVAIVVAAAVAPIIPD